MTIDWWTLGIQTINVAILVWLLGRFFWRPVAAMIEQRRNVAQTMLKEAEAGQNKAAAALTDIEKTRAGFSAERDAILAAARDEAAKAATSRLAEEATAAAGREAAARAAIAQDRADAEKAWARSAASLATDIAGRLAGRLDGTAVRAAFLDWLLQGIRALPETVRQAAAAEGAGLLATTATPLDPAEQDRCRALIGEAFGSAVEIAFKVDPALIAGFELSGPHLEVANSWRADLARIQKDLAHGD
ncbi:MAG: atpF [Rubritepida sp.]|nr:atpF [Rubritepida sp.]